MPVRRNRHRNVHQKRQSLPGGQDDEEKGASRGRRPSRGLKIRRMPFRTTRVRTQSANMRVTAKQRGCDRSGSCGWTAYPHGPMNQAIS